MFGIPSAVAQPAKEHSRTPSHRFLSSCRLLNLREKNDGLPILRELANKLMSGQLSWASETKEPGKKEEPVSASAARRRSGLGNRMASGNSRASLIGLGGALGTGGG